MIVPKSRRDPPNSRQGDPDITPFSGLDSGQLTHSDQAVLQPRKLQGWAVFGTHSGKRLAWTQESRSRIKQNLTASGAELQLLRCKSPQFLRDALFLYTITESKESESFC